MLVVNVTWRGKTYVGTLLDCTRHTNQWSAPRLVSQIAIIAIIDIAVLTITIIAQLYKALDEATLGKSWTCRQEFNPPSLLNSKAVHFSSNLSAQDCRRSQLLPK